MHRSAELQSAGLVTCFTILQSDSNATAVDSGERSKQQ